ncbi:MAG: N-6 DNA methylase [Armatimonadota bacterium]
MSRASHAVEPSLLALRLRFLAAADQLRLLPAGVLAGVVRAAERERGPDPVGALCASLLDSRRQRGIRGLMWGSAADKGETVASPALRQTAVDGLGELCQQAASPTRRRMGCYYTPRWVAEMVARSCVRGLSDARTSVAGAAPSLKILDPAAGAGALLVAMVDAIADASGEGEEDNDVRRSVVSRCLIGHELDPLAAEACRLSLWLTASRPGRPAIVPQRAVQVRDTLAVPPPRRRYDIVIGNPPWGVELPPERAAEIAAAFPQALGGHRDSFLFFLALAAESARGDGALGMVLPDAVLSQVRYEGVRQHLLRRFRPLRIDRLGKAPFPEVTAPACCLCLIGRGIAPTSYPTLDHGLRRRAADGGPPAGRVHTPRDAPLTAPHHSFIAPPSEQTRLLGELGARLRPLGELTATFSFHDCGINYPTAAAGRRILYTGERQHSADIPVTRGRDFRALTAIGSSAWLRHDWQQQTCGCTGVSVRAELYREVPKLLLRQTGDRPVATLDREGVFFGRSVIAITGRSEQELLWLAAVLNSSTFAALYRSFAPETGRPFAQVKVSKLKLVPVPPLEQVARLADVAAQVSAESEVERRESLMAEMDDGVARAYGLSYPELTRLLTLAGLAPAETARPGTPAGTSSEPT